MDDVALTPCSLVHAAKVFRIIMERSSICPVQQFVM